MPAKSHKAQVHQGTVLRSFLNPDRSPAAAVELPSGDVIRADTLTKLTPGAEVDATFDRQERRWWAQLRRQVA